ncbi:type II toxin-antitoxin system RelE/ParE family toxin [Lactobacillus sp. ESL0684]|nr:type II toxin-antitoxin system RelE/ParE family toxin [Lactobacillus sp. ESL0684]WEV43550.1 type II toxin-antitoxin system RelE/ParE family toxin [Lactobacillus sp. ESL0684]
MGQSLEGNLQTYWKYRVGKYRVLAEIHDQEFIVLVIKVANRNDVYKE